MAGRGVGIWDRRGEPGRPRAEATEPRTGGPPHDRRVDRSSIGGTPLSSGPGRASRRARGRRGCSAQSAVPGGRTGPRRLTSGLRAPAPAITGRAPLQLRREVPLGGPAAAGRGPTASRAGAARRRSPRRGRAAPRRRRLALGSPLGCGRGRGLPGPVRSRWTTVSQIGQQGEQRGAQIGLPSGGLRRAGPGAPGSRRRAGRGRRGRPLQRGLAGAGGGGGQVRGGGAGDGGQKPEKTGGGGVRDSAGRSGAPGCTVPGVRPGATGPPSARRVDITMGPMLVETATTSEPPETAVQTADGTGPYQNPLLGDAVGNEGSGPTTGTSAASTWSTGHPLKPENRNHT